MYFQSKYTMTLNKTKYKKTKLSTHHYQYLAVLVGFREGRGVGSVNKHKKRS